jgi:hypothetical protein
VTGNPGRRAAGALARTEVRHLARSPLLWLGFALAAVVAALELRMFWPALAGDDMVGYRGSFMLGGGALLAGAWLASRDQASGTADLLAVTPTARWRLAWARLLAVAAGSAAVFGLLFAVVLAVSAARGGRGTPDARLLADGALSVALGGLVGMAVGRLAGSRLVPVLAAPAWVAGGLYLANDTRLHELPLAPQRLSPLLGWEERSAVYGFLPDALWPHLGYLLGLATLAGVGLLLLAGGDRPPPARVVVAAAVAGLVLAAGGGARLVTLPDREVVLGPADRRPLEGVDGPAGDPAVEAVYEDPAWGYPEDGRATACAGDATLSVCVYPAYGKSLARYVHRAVAPVAGLVSGLPGVPHRVRMVPTGGLGACPDGELQVHEQFARNSGLGRGERNDRLLYADLFLGCVVGRPWLDAPGIQDSPDAQEAVKLWALLAGGALTREQLARETDGGISELQLTFPPGPVAPVALRMAALPPERVRRELAPLLTRLRAGELPASELPGQPP